MLALRSLLRIKSGINCRSILPARACPHIFRLYSQKAEKNDEDETPIQFTRSPASKWRAQYTRQGVEDNRLWYEAYVIIGSLVVFMIYFCVLREENDIDLQFERSLLDRVDGLEEVQLRTLLDYNLSKGLETEKIINRLKELEAQRTA